nr:MAG TPA: hypothetical protein [Caudoviricetes sp.]
MCLKPHYSEPFQAIPNTTKPIIGSHLKYVKHK